MTERWFFDVTDVKQYVCCPRLLYYSSCLPDIRPLTYTMQVGTQAHQQEEDREARRSLQRYGLAEGQRLFHYPVVSERLGLKGLIDMVIITPSLEAEQHEVVPVEYKYSEQKIGPHFKVQLACYALLLEGALSVPVRRAFFYSIPKQQAEEIPITTILRRKVEVALQEMRQIAASERMPAPTKTPRRCPTCEFRRFCNDVV